MEKLKVIFLIVFLFQDSFGCDSKSPRYRFPGSNVFLNLLKSDNGGTKYSLVEGSNVLQSVYLDSNYDNAKIEVTETGFRLSGLSGHQVELSLTKTENFNNDKYLQFKISRILTKSQETKDCVDLEIGQVNWYGGPEHRYQYWPVEKATYENTQYVSKEQDNCAVTERYWLNSRGVFFFIEDEAPLFIEQNSKENPNKLCFIVKNSLPYNTRKDILVFNYHIGIHENMREAHLQAINNFLKKPVNYPDERMVKYPIWSTWALYKREINDSIVREFGNKIIENNFPNSQLEIDDDWEECYGALTFNQQKFSNIKQLTDDLKKLGFRVTLWIHPFINKNCHPWYEDALSRGYLVLDHNGDPSTQWWNSGKGEAAYVDFTKPEAAEWFTKRLEKLQLKAGIDSFKFDAGETSWSPNDPVLTGNVNKHPNLITIDYVRTVAKFGPIVEVRSAQGTQDLPIFLRMIDKDTAWSWNNGLLTLITTLLQLNMVGYPFVLPDMIGGNGYDGVTPDKEIFIRWLQANVFMPSLQFSFVPWNFDREAIELSSKFIKLHEQYSNVIMERFKLAVKTGEPVNPPLWWIDSDDNVARQIFDEFLLGEDIIVAPIVEKGAEIRDIYLPRGKWQDGNTNEIYNGPRWLMFYKAPLSVLPYFLRVKN